MRKLFNQAGMICAHNGINLNCKTCVAQPRLSRVHIHTYNITYICTKIELIQKMRQLIKPKLDALRQLSWTIGTTVVVTTV